MRSVEVAVVTAAEAMAAVAAVVVATAAGAAAVEAERVEVGMAEARAEATEAVAGAASTWQAREGVHRDCKLGERAPELRPHSDPGAARPAGLSAPAVARAS